WSGGTGNSCRTGPVDDRQFILNRTIFTLQRQSSKWNTKVFGARTWPGGIIPQFNQPRANQSHVNINRNTVPGKNKTGTWNTEPGFIAGRYFNTITLADDRLEIII